jgi:hypothetical protein
MPSAKHILVYSVIALVAVAVAVRVPAIGSLVFPAKAA